MIAYEDYLARIEAVLGRPLHDGRLTLDLHWDTTEEARQHTRHINQMKRELNLIRKQVGQTAKHIRSAYAAEMVNVQPGCSSFLIGRRHATAIAREDVRQREVAALTQYEYVISVIDSAIVQLDRAKLTLQDWMMEHRGSKAA